MQLYKRKDGRSPFWFVDLTDRVTGKRVRRSTGQTDKKAAMKVAVALAASSSSASRDTTLGAALSAYVQGMRADGKRSWTDAQIKADKLVGAGGAARWGDRFSLSPDLKLTQVTPQVVQQLKASRAAEGNSPGTIAAELRILRAACKLAEDSGFLPAGVRKWGLPPPVRRLRYLTPEEAQRVLTRLHPDTPIPSGSNRKLVVPTGPMREARQDVHDLFLMLILTGGRWNEVAKLTWQQVDFKARTIRLYGWKGGKERTVPMVDEVTHMLARRWTTKRGAYVFPGDGGNARFGPTKAITRAMTAEGLNAPETVEAYGRATIHSLRHTYASWLRQRGLGLDEIQPLLGHADIATTRIYAKVVDAETFKRARSALQDGTLVAKR
jgi:integrase